MSFTLAQLETETRALLNEATPSFFGSLEIQSWLSQAAISISTMSHCVEVLSTVALAPSTIIYPAPGAFTDPPPGATARLIKVYAALLNNKALTRIHPRMLAHITDVSDDDPTKYWALFGSNIFFYPVGSAGSGTVQLLSSVVTADPLDLPDAWQLLCIPWAASRGKLKDNKFAEASVLYNEVMNAVTYQRRDLLERHPSSRAELTLPDTIALVSQAG